MHVLICDDDAATRFVIKRMLTKHLQCQTTECADGMEVLRQLERGDTDLVLLDVEMPLLDGVEVLKTIRSSETLKSLPVLMLSKERRRDQIVRLVALGIEGYILKPPRAEKLVAALERLRQTLSLQNRAGREGGTPSIALAPDRPALLVDGHADYRSFFVSQAAEHGRVIEAGSGAAALVQFRQTPVGLVFLGSDLGVLGADLLLPKLKALAGSQPTRIVRLVDPSSRDQSGGARFDDVMVRSRDARELDRELRRFAGVQSPLAAMTALAGDISEGVTSATGEACTAMLNASARPVASGATDDPMIAVIADIRVWQRYVVQLGMRATVPAMTHLAARLAGREADSLGIDDSLAAASELAMAITGRLAAQFNESGAMSQCSPARVERAPAPWDAAQVARNGFVLTFQIPAIDVHLLMSVCVADLPAAGEDMAAESAPLQVPPGPSDDASVGPGHDGIHI